MSAGGVAEMKLACCATWQHPAVRLLLGDHLHPGGRELTEAAIEAIDVAPGDVVVDVGCGPGSSLRLMEERGIRAIGVDLSEVAARQASGSGSVLVGDGERLPLSNASIDGAVVECVLSLLPHKVRALDNLKRALKPGSRVAVSDVVVEEPLPAVLEGAAAWSCCIGGAVSKHDYVNLLSDSGFEVIGTSDHSEALTATIDKVRRRLSLFEISAAIGGLQLGDLGISSDALERARIIAAALIEEVRDGALGYVLITARSPLRLDGNRPGVSVFGEGGEDGDYLLIPRDKFEVLPD